MVESGHLSLLDFAVESHCLPGERESGDRYTVNETTRGVLIGVVDGLGHGSEAAAASSAAVNVIKTCAEEPLVAIANACHRALRPTRGVVLTLALVSRETARVTWLGIGNVEGTIIRPGDNGNPSYETIVVQSGVLGFTSSPLHPSSSPFVGGDFLIFTTDGIAGEYVLPIVAGMRPGAHRSARGYADPPSVPDPKSLARFITSTFRKGNDDALVLVARINGGEP